MSPSGRSWICGSEKSMRTAGGCGTKVRPATTLTAWVTVPASDATVTVIVCGSWPLVMCTVALKVTSTSLLLGMCLSVARMGACPLTCTVTELMATGSGMPGAVTVPITLKGDVPTMALGWGKVMTSVGVRVGILRLLHNGEREEGHVTDLRVRHSSLAHERWLVRGCAFPPLRQRQLPKNSLQELF